MTAAIGAAKAAPKAIGAAKAAPKAAAAPKKLAQTKSVASQLPSGPNVKPSANKKISVRSKVKAVGKSQVPKKIVKKANKLSFDSKFAPRQKPTKTVVTYRHILALEFWVGLLLILSRPKKYEKGNVIIQSAAFIFVMMILFGMTAAGRSSAKFAAALGGLIVLTLAIFQVDVKDRFAAITTKPKNKVETPGGDFSANPGPPDGPQP